ncbi:MAG: inositol monophosphatase [Capsulimonadales bacterium]|nr:inositol monophosphatase [Capsulimonadales bacterium]
MNSWVTEELCDWVARQATEAATRAAAMLASGPKAEFKADGTIVTEIDRATERFLRAAIGERFPEHAVLGEEYGYDARSADVPLWAIDPVDGTVNLANGLPFWCVSVGLIVDDVPRLGVIVAPTMGQTFLGGEGLGVTLNGRPLAPVGAGRPLTWEDTYGICSASAREVDFQRLPCRLRVQGSAALELAYTAAGLLKGCQSIGTSLYDVAAGMAMCRELGAAIEWHSGPAWTPSRMLSGEYRRDILLTAPPETLAFVRERLRPR